MTDIDNQQTATPGSTLARARRAQDLELAEAARRLKLPRSILEQIEADRFDRIAAIYRRGYVTNYAHLLGLDPAPLLEAMGGPGPEPLRAVLPAARPRRFEGFVRFATYALVSTVIVLPLVYSFVAGGARLFDGDVFGPTAGTATGGEAAESSGYRARIAEALALAEDDSGGEESHLSASTLPLNAIRPIESAPAPSGAEQAAGPDREPADPRAHLRLVLEADSWIEVEDRDGTRLEFDLLRAGVTREYRGMAPFELLIGRASAVSIYLDGEPVVFDGQERDGIATVTVEQVPSSGDPGGRPAPAVAVDGADAPGPAD